VSDAVDLTWCLKLIAAALHLSRHDVARAVTLGGVPCTPTHADPRRPMAQGARRQKARDRPSAGRDEIALERG
jgi:hypothetical protein